MERRSYKGWKGCAFLSNGSVEMVVLAEAGPRIIRFALAGGENELREFPDLLERGPRDKWHVYGGHRLWHAPEDLVRTYCPDNDPVEIQERDGVLRVVQQVEKLTGIRKEMDIRLLGGAPSAEITHRLVNTNVWAVETAAWAPTLLERGGRAFLPLPPRGVHPEDCIPTATIALWPYTDMTDPRFTWGSRYVVVRQDPSLTRPQKVGVRVTAGWCAHLRAGRLFLKSFRFDPEARYPELGSPVTVFINGETLELETMGPYATLLPGSSLEYVEQWSLFEKVPDPHGEDQIDAAILPLVERARKLRT